MGQAQIWTGCLLSSLLLLAGCESSNVIMTSKFGTITQKEYATTLNEQYGKQALYQMMVEKALLATYKISNEEAQTKVDEIKKKMGNPAFQDALKKSGLKDEKAYQKQLKVELAMEKGIRATITDKDLHDWYKPQMKVSQVVIKDEKKANEIKEKLKNKEDFTALAKQYSEDISSKESGGDLGYWVPGRLGKKGDNAIYKLNAGEVSAPIKSQDGYHIIKVTEKKELQPFEQEKDRIRKELETERTTTQAPMYQQIVTQFALKNANIKVKKKDLQDTFKDMNK